MSDLKVEISGELSRDLLDGLRRELMDHINRRMILEMVRSHMVQRNLEPMPIPPPPPEEDFRVFAYNPYAYTTSAPSAVATCMTGGFE